MNRKIYREIAKKHGVTVAEVKREMQETITEAYNDSSFHARCANRKGESPTVDEFIDYIARKISSEEEQD